MRVKKPLKTRFGIHYGKTLVGNVGSSERINYTIIGDSVNIASRLEGANKQFGTNIIISEDVYLQIKDKVNVRYLESILLKGKTVAIKIYEVIDLTKILQ
ncbi:MAG: adenylate/guanylate cyclase domain-containing protein [Campylobacterales bacterium]|nr:adenylate/guanylate cyclase domain-containing protein [Campylobacterales bacterium]